jgi:hypothetical protein
MVQNNVSGSKLNVALLHHSIRDKRGALVTTAVTNLDIHDISRSSRTYGVKQYYLVNPLEEQHQVVKRIMGHWQSGGGRDYNPDRAEAFSRVQVVSWLQDAVADIEKREGKKPLLVMTTARAPEGIRKWHSQELRRDLPTLERPVLLVFGTGWGIDDDLLRTADAVLEAIEPAEASGYNHLSVRSAVAIFLDRILGAR